MSDTITGEELSELFPFVKRGPDEEIKIETLKSISIDKASEKNTISVKEHNWVALVTEEKQPRFFDESGEQNITFNLSKGRYIVCSDGKISKVTKGKKVDEPDILSENSLQLFCDAPDELGIDGVGEISADGKSFCSFEITCVNSIGEVVGTAMSVLLRATGGKLMDSTGKKRIRQIKLTKGKGKFRLVSDSEPKLVSVSAKAKNTIPEVLQVEFV